MGENIRFAFQGIWAHKMRSFLTMLGVIIGIASIIAIVSTIKGTNEQIMENVIGSGNNGVTVSLQQGESEYYMDESEGNPNIFPISDKQKQEIRELKDVEDASFYHTRGYVENVVYENGMLESGSIRGIDDHYLNTCGYVVYMGRRFVQSDYDTCNKVLLLDETAADIMYSGENPIGKIIEIKGEPFAIIGLIREENPFQPVINSYEEYQTYHQEDYGVIYMPDTCWPIVYNYDEPEECVAKAKQVRDMSNVGKEVAEIMNRSINQKVETQIAYKAVDLLEKARKQQQLSSGTNSMLIWIASIALLVGGIGVMNIMLVSVTERTSEIGLKKALGAKKKWILAQFLTESAVLTSIGGIIGVVSGLILAQIISRISGAPVGVSIPAIIIAVAFSMLIGIIFGMLPSYKAANLDPIEALRRE